MKISKWLILLLAFTLTFASKAIAFDNCQVLSSSPSIELKWNVLPDSSVEIAIQSNIAGNLVIGLAPQSHHNFLDLWLISGENNLNGLKNTIEDGSMKKGKLSLDSKQDLSNASIMKNANGMLARFQRPLNTHDKDDVSLSKGPLSLYWDFNANNSFASGMKPSFNGPISIDFEKPSTCTINAEMDSQLEPNIRAPAPAPAPVAPPQGPTYTSPGGDFIITWEIDQNLGIIHVEMKGRTQGWISMGFSDSSTMNGADYYTGNVVGGKATLLDTWSTGKSVPPNDKIQSAKVTGSSQDGTFTTIQFTRKLITNDPQDWPLTDKDLVMQWAYAPTTRFSQKHSRFGTVPVNLFSGKIGGFASVFDAGAAFAILIVAISIIVLIIQALRRARKARVRRELSNQESENARKSVELPNITTEDPIIEEGVLPEPKKHRKFKYKTRLEDVELEKKPKSCWFRCLGCCCHKRIACLHAKVSSLFLALMWALLSLGCLFAFSFASLSNGFGMMATVNSMFLMLPATRNSLLVWLFKIPFDRAIMYHRWLGYWTLILVSIHAVWSMATFGDFASEMSDSGNIFGLISWISLLVVLITSIEIIRRKAFQVFYYLHFFFLTYFIFGFFHSDKFIPYGVVGVGLYVIDRIVRIFWGIFPTKTDSLEISGEKDKIIKIRFKKHWLARLAPIYKPGQYVFVNFPGVHLLEWHPFSICSGSHEKTGEIAIKPLGNFTEKVIERAEKRENMFIRVDGPYGRLRTNYRRYPYLTLFCGGIGIAPCLGMLRTIFRTGHIASGYKEKATCIQKVTFVWAVSTMEQYNWFAKELSECYENSETEGRPILDIFVYVTQETINETSSLKNGRPNPYVILKDVKKQAFNKAMNVFVCGPVSLVETCWKASNELKKTGQNCHFHYENFEF